MEKKSILKKITGSREASLVIVLILLCVAVTIKSPNFMSAQNILEILKNNAVIMIMALGMLCVLLIGGIDISITSTLAFAGMTIGMMYKYNKIESTFVGFLIATAMGAVCGLLIGVIIAYGKVMPIIATMGFMYIYRGFAYLVAQDQWAGADALGSFKDFTLSNSLSFGLINNTITVTIICYIIFFIVLKWTKFGRSIYAVGSNAEAAEISGINVAMIKTAVYTIMGTLAGLCGALATSVYASAQPNMQTSKEMDVIAACVIGGVSFVGGIGKISGIVIGVLMLRLIFIGLTMANINQDLQYLIKGGIILFACALDMRKYLVKK